LIPLFTLYANDAPPGVGTSYIGVANRRAA